MIQGCSSKSPRLAKPSEDAGAEVSEGGGARGESEPDVVAGRRRFRPLGVGGDGFPRATKTMDPTTGQLRRLDFDFNADGRVEFAQDYDSSGAWVEKESADLDGDGRFDVVSTFEKKGKGAPELILQELNSRYENRTAIWKSFRNGLLVKRSLDRRGRGKPDYWEFYENSKLVRVERDEDGDGRPDKGVRFPEVVKPEGGEPGKASAR